MSTLTSPGLSTVRMEPEGYVSSDEAASFLKLNPRTLQRLAREGNIPPHSFGERRHKTWRFLLSELDEWMKAKVNSSRRPCHSIGKEYFSYRLLRLVYPVFRLLLPNQVIRATWPGQWWMEGFDKHRSAKAWFSKTEISEP